MTRVWITRSEPGASAESELLTAYGYDTLKYPLVQVKPLDPWRTLVNGMEVNKLGAEYLAPKVVVALSVHAVNAMHSLGLLESVARSVSNTVPWIAVGSATAEALKRRNIPSHVPNLEGTEGILAMSEVRQLTPGSCVWLISGVGGRELLQRHLQDEQGADVVKFELYERVKCSVDRTMVADCDVICFASVGSVESCAENFPGLSELAGLFKRPIVVASPRIGDAARALGFDNITVADNAGAQAMLHALQAMK